MMFQALDWGQGGIKPVRRETCLFRPSFTVRNNAPISLAAIHLAVRCA